MDEFGELQIPESRVLIIITGRRNSVHLSAKIDKVQAAQYV